jgi:hypothetical protein
MNGGRLDWLAEIGGATALAAAGGYAALKLIPAFAPVAGAGCLAVGLIAIKAVKPEPRRHVLPEFALDRVAADELLLETVYEEPLLLEDLFEEQDDALLLEDALPKAEPESRVVQLFAHPAIPTPGQLKDRIDRHLAGAPQATLSQVTPPQIDASEALYAALNELKRSLR